jgi:cytochrome P450
VTGDGPIYYDPFDPDVDRQAHGVWRRMREEQPVYRNDRYGFYALSRFEDVWVGYHDTTTFSSTHGVMLETLDHEFRFPLVIFMDPPEHDSMRKLVSRAFTPRRVNQLTESIQQLVDGYLDEFVGSDGFDYVEQFGALVPPVVIGEMLGVPLEDRDMMRRWFDDMLHKEDDSSSPTPEASAALREVNGYAKAMIADRRQSPRDDMVTALVEAEVEELDGTTRHLDDDEIALFVTLLAGAGSETVARLLGFAAVELARNPDQRRVLVDDPSVIPNAVEELLRYEAPSPANGRWTLKPFEAHGVVIPEGSKVLLLNGSANRDPREFSDPDRLDVRRTINRHITFGYGSHFCLGAALARLEGRIALAATLERFPEWEVVEDEVVRVRTSTVRGYSSVPIRL